MRFLVGLISFFLLVVAPIPVMAENIFKKIGNAVGNAANSVAEKVGDVAGDLKEKAEDKAEEIKEKIEERKDNDDSDEDDDDDDDEEEEQDDDDDNEDSDKKYSDEPKVIPRLSDADAQQRMVELKDNAQKMRDKEQSTENKLLGATTIGATSIGGMQLASGIAEQSADDATERDMRAYLATFRCDYGTGRNIVGGETNIQLPNSDTMSEMVAEYRALATDIAQRKVALGMSPGIESELVLDSATMNLYNDVSIGTRPGAFTSVARALINPDSTDATAWAKQKQDAQNKKNTGLTIATVGVVGGISGNLAINSGDENKNKSDEIMNKYEQKKTTGVQNNTDGVAMDNFDDNDGCKLTGMVDLNDGVCACGPNTVRQGDNCVCDAAAGYFPHNGFCVNNTVGSNPSVERLMYGKDRTSF